MKSAKQFSILWPIIFLSIGCFNRAFSQDGSLDLTFGTNGIVFTSIDEDDDYGYDVAIQPDGKILVAGTSVSGNNDRFALARYNTDGTLDTTFGSDGKVITSVLGADDDGQSVALQSDGKIIVAGYSYNGSNGWDFALVRYNTDGSVDSSFDSDGTVVTPIGSGNDYGYDVAIQSDGKILLAGESDNGNNIDFALVRYNNDGSLDNTFDSDGIVTTPVGSTNDIGQSVAIQSDGKILVAGYSYSGNYPDFAIVRYNSDGSMDNTFDSDGIVTTSVGSSNFGHSVIIQSDGKIVLAGDTYIGGSSYEFALLRYNTDGTLDNTFGSDGTVITTISKNEDYAYCAAIQSDGKIVVSGDTYNSGTKSFDFALARYNSDGSLDNSFGSDGIVTTPIESSSDLYGYSVIIQPDGKIIIAGDSVKDYYWGFTMIRYDNPSIQTSVQPDANLPDGFSLSQNYPNPFNSVTTISYSISTTTYVKLNVYNVFGKVVKQLVNKQQSPGEYQVQFDADGLAEGLYLVKIEAAGFSQTKNAILTK